MEEEPVTVRCFRYARKSPDDRGKVSSIQNQDEITMMFCNKPIRFDGSRTPIILKPVSRSYDSEGNVIFNGILSEVDVSGTVRIDNRPKFKHYYQTLRKMWEEAGKPATHPIPICLVKSIDRFGRDSEKSRGFTESELMLREIGIRVFESSYHQPTGIEKDAKIMINKQAPRQGKIGAEDGHRRAIAKSRHISRPPFGYIIHYKKPGEKGDVKVDKKVEHIVKEIFSLVMSHGFKGTADIINKRHHLTLGRLRSSRGKSSYKIYKKKIFDMVKNPYYLGLLKHKNYLYKGNFPALVERSLFEKINPGLLDKYTMLKSEEEVYRAINYLREEKDPTFGLNYS